MRNAKFGLAAVAFSLVGGGCAAQYGRVGPMPAAHVIYTDYQDGQQVNTPYSAGVWQSMAVCQSNADFMARQTVGEQFREAVKEAQRRTRIGRSVLIPSVTYVCSEGANVTQQNIPASVLLRP